MVSIHPSIHPSADRQNGVNDMYAFVIRYYNASRDDQTMVIIYFFCGFLICKTS